LKTRVVVIIGIVILAAVVGELYISGTFGKASDSCNCVTIDIQITGGVSPGTVDKPYPNVITVKLGQNVTLAIQNTDDNTHGFVQSALGLDTGKIPPGQTYYLTFVADKTGTFSFTQPTDYCTGGYGNVCNSIQDVTLNMTVTS
jgi:Cupredoxin-like domain